MIKRRLKEQAGFTLIEMLIVVILLGILEFEDLFLILLLYPDAVIHHAE